MTSPTNTWSTDKPYNLRQNVTRNNVDSSKLKSPLASGSIIKPTKIIPGSETRATSASPVGNKKTTTATETKKTKDKKSQELESDKSNNAATTVTVEEEIKLPDCRVLLKDSTKDENQIEKKPESTDRIVIITDPTAAETRETQDTVSDLTGVTKTETRHTKETKDKDKRKRRKRGSRPRTRERQETRRLRGTNRRRGGRNRQRDEEEEEDEETQTQNFDKLFGGPIALKDGQPLLTPTNLQNCINTGKRTTWENLQGRNI